MARNFLGKKAAVSVIIDGRAIDNLGQDVPITVTFPDTQSAMVMGLNGFMGKTGNTTLCELTIGLLPNSDGNDILFDIYANQRGVLGELFDISIVSDVNENLEFQQCLIKQAAELAIGGDDITNRDWVFNVGIFVPDGALFPGAT